MSIPMPLRLFRSGGRSRSGGERGAEAREFFAARFDLAIDDPERDPTSDAWATRFGRACDEQGPLFRVFARALARRADLLTVSQCWALLEAAPDRLRDEELLSPDELRAVLRRDRDTQFLIWRELDSEPYRVGALHQDHAAVLETGEAAFVRCVRPDLAARAEAEVEAFVSCEPFFPRAPAERGRPPRPFPIEEIVRDLRDEIAQRLDQRRTVDAFAVLTEEAVRSDALVVPTLAREHCTEHVLVFEHMRGVRVDRDYAGGLARDHAFDLGRRMAFVWMQQALTGSLYPLDVEILELDDGRLAWIGGVFAQADDETRKLHWRYLRAVAAHDPDTASECLLRAVDLPGAAKGGFDESLLRTRIRQVLPVSGSGLEADRWGRGAEGLAEYVLLHWQTLHAGEARIAPPLAQFYRGFFEIARRARGAAGADGCLDAGLKDLCWMAGWNQFRQFTAPTRLGPLVESSLWGLTDLPGDLDRAFEIAARGEGFEVKLAAASPETSKRRNLTAASAALLLALIALAFLSTQFAAQPAQQTWIASAFLLCGGMQLLLFLRLTKTSARS